MRDLRKASGVMNELPWEAGTVTLILVGGVNGTSYAVSTVEKRELARRAAGGEGHLLAVWPGKYSTDVFEVDDLAGACEYLELSAAKAATLRSRRYLSQYREQT